MVLGARSAEGQKAKYSLRANDARSGPDNGHTATAAACPVRAKSRLMHRNKKGDLFDHLSAHACAGSFGQPRLPKALNQ